MFTIKLYNGFRQIIQEADSFTILRGEDGCAEITLHRRVGDDTRVDIKYDLPPELAANNPPTFEKAIIENSAGRTTEIVWRKPSPDKQAAVAA